MTPEEIKVEIFKRRKTISMEKIAKSLDPPVTRQMVFFVTERRSTSKRVAEAIAKAIEKDKRIVFPEYFLKKRSSLALY